MTKEEFMDDLSGRIVDVPDVGSRMVLIHFTDMAGVVLEAEEDGAVVMEMDDGTTGHFCARDLIGEDLLKAYVAK
jgi:hypothetical protein